MTTNYDKCFEKHSFDELNNIDVNVHLQSLKFIFNKFKINKKTIDTMSFFDVGCNAGSFIKILKHYGIHQNIHCFEPHPILSKKTKEVYPYIKMNELCLSNNTSNIELHIPTWSVGLSSVINRPVFSKLSDEGQVINKLNVKCNTIDAYCQENNIKHIFFMKIDVEGAEKMVLEGGSEMLKNKKIFSGIFEIGETLKDANTDENEICRLLEGYGYKIVKTISRNDYIFHI